MSQPAALLDTSVLIARESGRVVAIEKVPAKAAVCVVTIAELHAGVLAARDVETRARRLTTLEMASVTEALPITVEAARRWAQLRIQLAQHGRRAKVNDLWIASVAQVNGMVVVTQDEDFDPIEDVGGPEVIRI